MTNANHWIKGVLEIGLRRIAVCFVMLILAGSSVAQDSTNLTGIVFSKLSGDNVQINMLTDAPTERPGTFSTDNPARIALDFFGVTEQLPENLIDIDIGKVESIIAVETPDRTRVIINLFDTARYEIVQAENGYAVTIFNTEVDDSPVRTPKPFAERNEIVGAPSVTNIDFRRSEAGGGSLVVDLNDDGITVDTRERDGEIVIDFLGVNVPVDLERRLDVTDFATPVQMIDAFQNSDNVRVVVVPQGRYQHLALQSGNRFTLVVDPIVETAEEIRNAEDEALGFTGERLSVNFQKIDVRSALAVIADFTGINFVTSDSVTGDITINLKDIPWDQALDVIMRSKGLSKRQNGNVIWVAPTQEIQDFEEQQLRANAVVAEFAPLETELLTINYARAADIARVLQPSGSNGGSGGGTNNLGVGTENSSSTGSGRSGSNNSLLTERGSVTVDQRTNTLLIKDVASKIRELRQLIASLDKPVRQVLIETRIVAANDDFSRELGARLGFQRVVEDATLFGSDSGIGNVTSSGSLAGLSTINDSLVEAADAGPFDNTPIAFDTSTGVPGGLAVDLGANAIAGTNAASYAFDIFRAGNGFANLISLELSALEADGRGKVVASPRLITANQREARISQGSEIFVTIPGEGGGVGGGTGGGGGGLETIEAELTLIVTPQITPDDRVILDVEINQDTIISIDPTVLGTQEIITQVLVDNGETIVIGGIYQEEKTEGVTKVPFLGDIPYLGALFKRRSRLENRSELLIFLTPKIITPKLDLG